MSFDKNISSGDLEQLRREVARLKARNPVFSCKYKYEAGGHYEGYGYGRRWVNEDSFENYKEGIPADDFQKTFEAARASCDKALSDLEDILKDVADYKKTLGEDNPDQSDYDKYYDALKRTGVQLTETLKVFPLANSYVLADVIMMMAEDGITAQDLKEVGINLAFLKDVLDAQGQYVVFRQYLLGSFEDDVENSNYDPDLLAKCLSTFILATGLDAGELLAQMKTIVGDVKKKKTDEKKFDDMGKEKKKDGGDVKKDPSKKDEQAENFDPDLLKIRQFIGEFEEIAPTLRKFIGGNTREYLAGADEKRIIKYARELFKFRSSEQYVKFFKDYEALHALIKEKSALEDGLSGDEKTRLIAAGLSLFAIEGECRNVLSRVMVLAENLSREDEDVYKHSSLHVLYTAFDNLSTGYLDSLYDNFRLLEEGKYDLNLFTVDFVEATIEFIPLATAANERVKDAERDLSRYDPIDIRKLQEIIVAMRAMQKMEEVLRDRYGIADQPVAEREGLSRNEGQREAVDVDLPSFSDFNKFNMEVLKGKGAYLIEVMNDYCPACKLSEMFAVGPYVKGGGSRVKAARINTESVDKGLSDWAVKNGYQNAIPHYFVVRGGKVIGQHRGAFKSEEELKKFLDEVLGAEA